MNALGWLGWAVLAWVLSTASAYVLFRRDTQRGGEMWTRGLRVLTASYCVVFGPLALMVALLVTFVAWADRNKRVAKW